MSTIAFQIENRRNEHTDVLMDVVKDWCEEKDVTYVRYTSGREDMVHYWWKVFKLYEIMIENPEYDLILWFDSDILIYDFKKDPRDLLRPGLDFVACHDPADPRQEISEDWFNAGLFCIRNTYGGRKIVKKWMSLYDETKWYKDSNGKWNTDDRWAGPNYEQGAFCEQILQKNELKNKIKIYDYRIFNEVYDWENPSEKCFSIHLMRGLAQEIGILCLWKHRVDALSITLVFSMTLIILVYLKNR